MRRTNEEINLQPLGEDETDHDIKSYQQRCHYDSLPAIPQLANFEIIFGSLKNIKTLHDNLLLVDSKIRSRPGFDKFS